MLLSLSGWCTQRLFGSQTDHLPDQRAHRNHTDQTSLIGVSQMMQWSALPPGTPMTQAGLKQEGDSGMPWRQTQTKPNSASQYSASSRKDQI
ncbi:hypothetical protein AOXY_G3249 [Acipenser oxyrinchus oxyrinchus]|uniref:Uncharacterized protein n=1 Tax=Acipenser oxyrinchus oxyrinchus TaxID=40147 RepID=A0AAD8LT63_ACIOX|nr:hypothetical protein AOXY_G3249 [Acipenser oxyrinchus oxyrinchus]